MSIMQRLIMPFALLLASSLTPAVAAGTPTPGKDQKPLNCDVGPVDKTYGKTSWLVYSCHDDQSLMIVSAAGSPALPFYFTFHLKDGVYQLSGEGTGNKQATDAAYGELKAFTASDIQILIQETKSIPAPTAVSKPAAHAPFAVSGNRVFDELIGTWTYSDKQGDIRMTFGADGVFSGTLSQAGKVVWTYAGTWTVDDNMITYVYTKSDPGPWRIGMVDVDSVLNMTDDCFTLEAISGTLTQVCRAR